MTPLAAGKLEQSCPDCGRWEAAHRYCSWCLRSMGPADWYLNGDTGQRHGRRPTAAPANPPTEYRDVNRWPSGWGKYPFAKAASPAQTPETPAIEPKAAVWRADGTLGLL